MDEREENMSCPRCGGNLAERERAGIVIDACPQCKGIWLDRGELDKIVTRESERYRDDEDDDDDPFERGEDDWRGDRRGRRGGFFGNLIDMFGD